MASDHPHRDGGSPSIRLALKADEAARALGIGERALWSLTNRNAIPHVRIGRRVLYPVGALTAWLAEQAAQGERR